MNKAEREQLKHNEAADAIVAANSYLSQHGRTLGLAAVAVLLLVGSVFGYRAFKARTEERAQGQLAAAVEILNAPVPQRRRQVRRPRLPHGDVCHRSGPGRRGAQAAARAPPTRLAARMPGCGRGTTPPRCMPRPIGPRRPPTRTCGPRPGRASTLLGRMASLGLASMQVRQKQFDPAIKALQELSQRRDGPLPVDAVLVQLAEAYQQAGRAAEASQTLQRVIDEFPQSPYAADARQRVEALPGVRLESVLTP